MRYAQALLEKYLKFSPLVGLIGHRQVGKTTLAGHVCNAYYTLDDEESVAYQVDSAPAFLREVHTPGIVAIDEVQLMPELFPAFKEWVRKHKRPGQFLISGSVRFTSLNSIRESLTGRIVNLELLPFSINELEGEPAPEIAFKLHQVEKFSERHTANEFSASTYKRRMKLIETFLEHGGLPGVCFVRDHKLRATRIRTQLETILDRDLRLLYPTRIPLMDLRLLASSLAVSQGQPLRISTLQRQMGVSARTVQNLIHAFENLFLIRSIPIEGDSRGSVIFFEDLAESNYLAQGKMDNVTLREHLCFLLLRSGFAYRPEFDPQYFHYKTRGGVTVPIGVRLQDQVSGWIPIQGTEPDRRESAAGRAFLAEYAHSKVFFVSFESQKRKILDHRRMILSIAELTT